MFGLAVILQISDFRHWLFLCLCGWDSPENAGELSFGTAAA